MQHIVKVAHIENAQNKFFSSIKGFIFSLSGILFGFVPYLLNIRRSASKLSEFVYTSEVPILRVEVILGLIPILKYILLAGVFFIFVFIAIIKIKYPIELKFKPKILFVVLLIPTVLETLVFIIQLLNPVFLFSTEHI